MDSLPTDSLNRLARILLADRSAAWCRLDAAGGVVASGGEWGLFGQAQPERGQSGAQCFAALQGLLPIEDALWLRSLDLGAQRVCDLHLLPEPEGTFVCLLDSSERTQAEARVQQQAYAMELLHADLARQAIDLARVDAGAPDPNRSVFEWDGGGRFQLRTPVESWLQDFLEGTDDHGQRNLGEQDPAGFLGNFMLEAQDFFASSAPGSLPSGTWVETDSAGRERCFEALALLDATGARGLILHLLPSANRRDQVLLQGVRESNLSLQDFKTEAQKKEVLLQCIVHDLRGPLSSMSAVLSILGQPNLDPSKSERLLEVARRQALRQDEMMREVLAVFAGEIRDLQYVERSAERAPDLGAVLQTTLQDRGPVFERLGLVVQTDLPVGGPWPVPGHRDRLARVIGNLLDNAARFSPRGAQIHLSLRVLEPSRAVELHVLDRGPGVPAEMQPRLFQRFSRGQQLSTPAASTESSVGTVGLGLFYCRTSVEAWGGRIGYSDRPAGGADFWIRLPLLSHNL